MCGIAGFSGFSDDLALAMQANIIQRHRGPDNQSVWHNDHIALAHQRLSIIDLSESANQPFQKHDLVIVFNGEIYNYKELREKLKSEKQVSFRTCSDTEVVLEMYLNYGEKCLDFFLGMFAFAIYNKSSGVVFIARDHFGIKPLFYTQINGAFAFSSELKTLINLPGFDKSINPKSLISCLNYLWVSGNETMFNNCSKLPPAHFLTFSRSAGLFLTRYWELDDNNSGTSLQNEKAVEKNIEAVMEQTVKRHIVADVPVSSFLSGGLDSSLISVIAAKHMNSLSTYTIGTLEKDKQAESMPDDEKYAAIVAEAYHFDHHVIRIKSDILTALPEMAAILDEPIGDPAAINTYLICRAAREKGVKILLSGMGADEIFFGYRRQKATLMALKFSRLPAFIKNLIVQSVKLLPVKINNKGFRFGRWAKRFLTITSLPIDQAYMRSYSYYDPSQLTELLRPEYRFAVPLLNEEHREIFNSKFKNDIVNRICYTDLNMFMLGLNLTYTDRASMAASVEVRVPFIDKIVVTEAMHTPGALKIKNNTSKYILKKAAGKFLPDEIIYRPKASFGAPIRSWISNDLKDMVNDLLSEENINKRGFLNYAMVTKMIDDDRKGIEDNAYQIYQLLTLELWCREYLDKTSSLN